MPFSPQEKEMLLQGAISTYIFNFAYESRNPGCEFDVDSWMKALDEFSSNDLMIMTPDKQKQLKDVLGDLDKYSKKKESILEKEENNKQLKLDL
ncbi:MAG: hypothetical protein J6O41_00485 [Clostridia bacterium]|nr:hypothetical protein [Clostridia bacterium]